MKNTPSLLVVEDDTFYVSLYQSKLSQEGYEVALARDGKQALVALEKQTPDLVQLDLLMPNMGGLQTLQAIRSDKRWKNLKVIVFSNLGQEEVVHQARQLGVTDYLVKMNISIQDMVSTVKQHLPK